MSAQIQFKRWSYQDIVIFVNVEFPNTYMYTCVQHKVLETFAFSETNEIVDVVRNLMRPTEILLSAPDISTSPTMFLLTALIFV